MDNKREDVIRIVYTATKDGELYIDIEMEDYSEETVSQLSSLYSSIPTEGFQSQSVQIIKEAFHQDGHDELFIKFLAEILLKQNAYQKQLIDSDMVDSTEEEPRKKKEEPLIKPSDLA